MPIDLTGWSLAWGGFDYVGSGVDLSGTIGAGQVFVVGGPLSNADNANPTFDLSVAFSPQLQNSGSPADGIGLFRVPLADISTNTIPVDAVIYGDSNDSMLIDETGGVNPPDVGDANPGQSIERVDLAGTWQIQDTPTPNTTSLSTSKTLPAGDTLDIVTVSYAGSDKIQVDLDLISNVDVQICYAADLINPVWTEIATTQLTPANSSVVVDISSLGVDKVGYIAVISRTP
jgi:hypothetical protein